MRNKIYCAEVSGFLRLSAENIDEALDRVEGMLIENPRAFIREVFHLYDKAGGTSVKKVDYERGK